MQRAPQVSAAAIPRRSILGIPVDAVSMTAAVRRCLDAIESRETVVVGVVNVAKLVQLQDDSALRSAISDCDLVIADGLPVVWAGALLGQLLPERVAGIDLFLELLGEAHRRQQSVYLLGATDEVLAEVVRIVKDRFHGVRLVGSRNGYFQQVDEPQVAEAIRASGADMLFIGISTPKKELFLARWGRQLSVPVCHGVGGSFDVLAGKVRRAPPLWRRLGLEWFYRLLQEPRRMWRRYLTTNSKFFYLLFRARVGLPRPLR